MVLVVVVIVLIFFCFRRWNFHSLMVALVGRNFDANWLEPAAFTVGVNNVMTAAIS